jgi:hypothetical protein
VKQVQYDRWKQDHALKPQGRNRSSFSSTLSR